MNEHPQFPYWGGECLHALEVELNSIPDWDSIITSLVPVLMFTNWSIPLLGVSILEPINMHPTLNTPLLSWTPGLNCTGAQTTTLELVPNTRYPLNDIGFELGLCIVYNIFVTWQYPPHCMLDISINTLDQCCTEPHCARGAPTAPSISNNCARGYL
jgi:hypothetical protein